MKIRKKLLQLRSLSIFKCASVVYEFVTEIELNLSALLSLEIVFSYKNCV